MADQLVNRSSANSRPTWRETLSDPTVASVIGYSALAIVALVAAYFALFTQFVGYDDEGTLLVTVKAFAQGHVLYRDIYSEYGPFYFELFGGLFALTGHAVTTDASRSIVMVVWVSASLLYGIVAQRLTGRLALGLAAAAGAFSVLYVLQAEPMHPQGLCALLLATFSLLAVLDPQRRRGLWVGAAAGAMLAALLLTKVNLGVYGVAAIVLAAVLTVEPLSRVRWLRWAALAAFLALPLVVMARDLDEAWVRELIVIDLLAAGALAVCAWPLRSAPGEGGEGMWRWLVAGAIGFAVAFVAILVAIFATGPTPADVYDGVITQALRVRDVLITPLLFPGAAVDWAIGAAAAAVIAVRLRSWSAGRPSIWPGLLRALAGLTILLVVAHIVPIGFNPTSQNPITLPMLLAWVATIPPAGREPAHKRFLRILLPGLAIAQTLQVYPVAGSQMGIAAVTFVPVGALCLADALTSLRAWSEARGEGSVPRLAVVALVLTVALAAEFGLDAMVRPGITNAINYHRQEALPFPGATALHLPPEQVETYSRLVDLLHQYRCSTFVSYPNVDSLYLWSGIEAPPPRAPGAWINALDDAEQQRVVDELKASPRPCAIRSEELFEAWLHGAPPPQSPLVRYIFNAFRPVAQAGEFRFLLPKEGFR